MFHCLQLEGIGLTSLSRSLVYLMACVMFHEQKKVKKVSIPDGEVTVHTDFSFGVLVSLAGTMYHAEISEGSHTTRMKFIVDDHKPSSAISTFDEGSWVAYDDAEVRKKFLMTN